MSKMVGTISRGVRAPIIREGDNLSEIVVDCVLEAAKSEPFEIRDKDVIAVTEAVVARAQGNYAGVEQIAKDVHGIICSLDLFSCIFFHLLKFLL